MFGFTPAPDAKYWHRLWSVRFLMLGTALEGVGGVMWVFGYAPWAQHHPIALTVAAAAINVAALASRLIDQKSVPSA